MLSLLNLSEEQKDELLLAVRAALGNISMTLEHHRIVQTRVAAAREAQVIQLARIADAIEERNEVLHEVTRTIANST